jgi:hypothetical protein
MTPSNKDAGSALGDELKRIRRELGGFDYSDVETHIASRLLSAGYTRSPAPSGEMGRETAYCGDQRKIEVSMAAWDGITHYLKALHKEGAVDDTKMKFAAYFPLEHCMTLWGIDPYKVQHDPAALQPGAQDAAGEWCPIDDAARDGREVLLRRMPDGPIYAGYYGLASMAFGAGASTNYPWTVLDNTNGVNHLRDGGERGVTHYAALQSSARGSEVK